MTIRRKVILIEAAAINSPESVCVRAGIVGIRRITRYDSRRMIRRVAYDFSQETAR
jgi:hypothetical protein